VHDAAGRLVDDLTQADFQVLDNGQPARVTTFSNDVVPITVSVLLDMRREHGRRAGRACATRRCTSSGCSSRATARASARFGDEIALSPWLTADKAILRRRPRRGSVARRRHAALVRDARRHVVARRRRRRRVLLVLSDGVDTGCQRSSASSGRWRQVRRRAEAGARPANS
jgi:hypothetical protein